MSKIEEAASQIISALHAAERSSSAFLHDSGLLLAAMAKANLHAGVALEADHECMEHLLSNISSQVAARGDFVRLHRRQRALAHKLCPDVLSEGACPPHPALMTAPAEPMHTLRVVNG